MGMLLVNEFEKRELTDVYVFANTPRSLYTSLRANTIVQNIAGTASVEEIIELFLKIGGNGIDNICDLSLCYALYTALTFKDYDKVDSFYNTEGAIGFEWFPEIRSMYIAMYKHTNNFSLSFEDFDFENIVEVNYDEFV
jgi:hypothetical protein